MRSGVLSDDYIMNNVCVEYRPVPLGKVDNVLSTSLEPKHNLELRQMKYIRPPPRPSSFFAMANSLSNQADPTNPLPFQRQLAQQYEEEVGAMPEPQTHQTRGQKRDAPDNDAPQMEDDFQEGQRMKLPPRQGQKRDAPDNDAPQMEDDFQDTQRMRPTQQGQKRDAPDNDVPQMGGIFQEAQRFRPPPRQGEKRNAPDNDVPMMGGIFQEAKRFSSTPFSGQETFNAAAVKAGLSGVPLTAEEDDWD